MSMSVLALCHRDVHFRDRWNIGGLNQTMDQLRCHRWKRQDETRGNVSHDDTKILKSASGNFRMNSTLISLPK